MPDYDDLFDELDNDNVESDNVESDETEAEDMDEPEESSLDESIRPIDVSEMNEQEDQDAELEIARLEGLDNIGQGTQIITATPDTGGSYEGGGGGGDQDAHAQLMESIYNDFNDARRDIIGRINSDRDVVDRYLAVFEERISDPNATKACYVEAITQLVNVRATSSVNIVRVLDAMAKMVSAAKNARSKSAVDVDLTDLL